MMNQSKDSLLGLQLDEYRLEELLGQGGMARVYRALDVKLMRYAAIKVIDAPYRRDAEYIKRFEREAQAIAKLEHANVVRLYRYGEVNPAGESATAQAPLLYMAMQYVQGKDLGYVLDSCRLDGEYVNPEEGLRVVQQVCQALDYVHAQGIIHRDVKPSNIMLSYDDGHAVLTDFGLALMTQLGTRGETFGSPHYIAPEQAVSSAKAVPQSDLYAVGVILFEMFTGVLPFNASDPLDVALLHMSAPPPNPRQIRPELSEEVEKVILKALEKKPEDRYPTGKDLAEALERALHWTPAAERPSRKTVLDRVSTGFAANPLPPIPAAVTPGFGDRRTEPPAPVPAAAPAAVPDPVEPAAPEPTPAREIPPTVRLFDSLPESQAPARATESVPFAVTPPARYPVQPAPADTLPPALKPAGSPVPSRRWLWIGGGILAVLMLGFLCMAGIAGLILSRLSSSGAQASPTQASGADAGLISATEDASGAVPVTKPTATPGTPKSYPVLIGRCKDEGCVVIKNTGKYPLAIADLQLSGKSGAVQGSEWGVELLLPGKCVRAVKDKDWLDRLPEGISCDVTGHNLTREGNERFWKDAFSVEYAGQKVGNCGKGAATCKFDIQK